MTLQKFIEKYGEEYCAYIFKAKVRTVASWRRGERFPRRLKAMEIVISTKGVVQMSGIYNPEG